MKKFAIHLVTFSGQHLAASTFLRFQENYECASPLFRGKAFSWETFMDWYARRHGGFSYLSEWEAFNVPSRVFASFRRGDFDPLTAKERALLDMFDGVPDPFYVIGAVEGDEENIAHELVHGLFFADEAYRKDVLARLAHFPAKRLRSRLAGMGYAGKVIDDEINAYVLTGLCSELRGIVPKGLKASLRAAFKERFRLNIGSRSDLRRLLRRVHRLKFPRTFR